MIKISFIIPIYNGELYLRNCLNSILNQNLRTEEFEVIMINDGSVDLSHIIIKEYETKHDNFFSFKQTNQGVGSARNQGINLATGNYLYFMDSDDWLLTGGMRILIDNYIIPNNFPDIITFCSHTVDKYYNETWDFIKQNMKIFHGSLKEFSKVKEFGFSVWNNLFSKDLIIKNKIIFTNHKIAEDMLFMLKVFSLENATILTTNLNIYRYLVNKKSTLNRIDKQHIIRIIFDLIDLSKIIIDLKNNSNLPDRIFNHRILFCQRWAFTRLCSGNLSFSQLKRLNKIIYRENLFPIGNPEKFYSLIDIITKNSIFLYLFSILYRYIFIRFLKPYVKRN